MSTPRVTQSAALVVQAPATSEPRITQLAAISVSSPPYSESRVLSFASIAVTAKNRGYVSPTVIPLDCWTPCTNYGTYATIIRFGVE